MRFELTTSTLARLRSTPELHPHYLAIRHFLHCQKIKCKKKFLKSLNFILIFIFSLYRIKLIDTNNQLLRTIYLMKIISATSNPFFSKNVSDHLNVPLTKATFKRFADNEIFVAIDENLRGSEVFIIQSTSHPANDNLMELLICIDAVKRASASRITAVIPYFGYARQDRKTGPRTPISAKLVADMIATAGADRVLTADLHSAPIQGYFNIPVDNLYASPIFESYVKNNILSPKLKVVSPDIGGVRRARELASRLGVELAIVDKYREQAGKSEVMNIIGDVKDYDCILIDDMIDSAGTICNAANTLKEHGANTIRAFATHGVLSGNAIDNINDSALDSLIITDTIKQPEELSKNEKLEILTIAPIFAEAISRIDKNVSLSSLFD